VRDLARWFLWTTLVAALLADGGCNIITPAAYIIEGPPSNDAQYTLPDRKVVVFVDDRTNLLSRTQLRTVIGDKVGSDLLAKELVPEVIASRDALAVARRDESMGKGLSTAEIGEKVGAEVVIYVRIMSFNLSEPGGSPLPNALARVRVIDATNRARLFPTDVEDPGAEVTSDMREVSTDLYRSTSGRRSIEEQLATNLGDRIGKLFYKHEKKELGKGVGIRK
jgi:hypothetical protein